MLDSTKHRITSFNLFTFLQVLVLLNRNPVLADCPPDTLSFIVAKLWDQLNSTELVHWDQLLSGFQVSAPPHRVQPSWVYRRILEACAYSTSSCAPISTHNAVHPSTHNLSYPSSSLESRLGLDVGPTPLPSHAGGHQDWLTPMSTHNVVHPSTHNLSYPSSSLESCLGLDLGSTPLPSHADGHQDWLTPMSTHDVVHPSTHNPSYPSSSLESCLGLDLGPTPLPSHPGGYQNWLPGANSALFYPRV